jgi:hypothetical protein
MRMTFETSARNNNSCDCLPNPDSPDSADSPDSLFAQANETAKAEGLIFDLQPRSSVSFVLNP